MYTSLETNTVCLPILYSMSNIKSFVQIKITAVVIYKQTISIK